MVAIGLAHFSALSGGSDPYIDIRSFSGIAASTKELNDFVEKQKQKEEKNGRDSNLKTVGLRFIDILHR
jgi:hypothetical protein